MPRERLALFGLAAVLAGAAAWHVAGIDGALLADDYGNLHAVFAASERGALWSWVLSLFYSPLGNGSYAYRPLQYVSHALEWMAFGANPLGWRAVTIALYFANAGVAGLVVRRWLRETPADAAWGGMLAAAVLAAYPFAGDVAYYPGCRADALACLFSLLYLGTFRVDGRSTPGTHVLRVAALAGALLSKESAMPMPLVATMLCFAGSVAGGPAAGRWRRATTATISQTWSSWVLLGVYLAWRGRLFGSIWKVYVNSTLPHDASELAARLAPFRFIVAENIGPHWVLWSIAVAGALAWAAATPSFRGMPGARKGLVAALFLAAGLYFVAPASSFDVSNSFGEGARHFYAFWMCVSVLLGMLFARGPRLPLLALVLILFVGQTQSLAQWRSAGMQMKRIVAAIEGFAGGIRDEQYALLLLPDHLRVALFARNAQGAIVMRPIQRADYLSRTAIVLGQDIDQWPQHLAGGKVSEFKGGRPFDPANFLGLYCWNPALGKIVPLTAAGVWRDGPAWRAEAARNFGPAGCLPPF